jgi:hypothetical protein
LIKRGYDETFIDCNTIPICRVHQDQLSSLEHYWIAFPLVSVLISVCMKQKISVSAQLCFHKTGKQSYDRETYLHLDHVCVSACALFSLHISHVEGFAWCIHRDVCARWESVCWQIGISYQSDFSTLAVCPWGSGPFPSFSRPWVAGWR